MAELPGSGKGKQPATCLKPSRLRHEIRPDSTDDEWEAKKHVVQEPASDTVVPESQLDYDGHYGFNQGFDNESDYGEDVPLSPNALALIGRTAMKKTTGVPDAVPFTVRLLSKDMFSLSDTSASSTTPSFSFGQRRKATCKTSPKEAVPTSQSKTHTTLTPPPIAQSEEQVANDSSVIDPPAVQPEPVTPEQVQQGAHDAEGIHDFNELLPSPLVSDTSHRQEKIGNAIPMPLEAISTMKDIQDEVEKMHLAAPAASGEMTLSRERSRHDRSSWAASGLPTYAQPVARLISGTKKIRTVKKIKKSRKGLLPQPCGGPWPPRPGNVASYTDQAVIDDRMSEAFADPRDLSQAEPQDDLVPEFPEDDMWAPSGSHSVQTEMHGYSAYTYHDADQANAQYNMQPSDMRRDTPQTMSQQVIDTSAQGVYPTSPKYASHGTGSQPSPVEPLEQSFPVAPDQAAATRHEDAVDEQQAVPLPQEPDHQFPTQINGADDCLPVTTRPAQPEVETNSARPAPQPKVFEAALHVASDRGGPHRVGKPRRKVRAVSGPLSHGIQAPSMSLGVERSLENLRVAMLADNFRLQHEHTMTTKQHEEKTALLNEMVGLQNDIIAEYKQKHHDLDGALNRLTDKAKTNQRYATGLQKDYESLQKSFTTLQDQSKKTLQAKIAEIVNEKDALCRQFEATVDVLTRSQKNLKSTVEDLYVRFTISDSKKKDLAENLRKQEAMYEEERRKRDDLEKQLLSGVQNMQRQLGDSSTALVDKLQSLQSSVNKLAVDDKQNVAIKECLGVLRTLQSTPFLTAKDVQKAEGMLRFIHEHVDSGLGAISETVKRKSPPNAELQDFIKQQLQCLRTDMVRYEDVVAENRKAYEANDTLKKQLETQQQHCTQLDEQIKAFQQTEADLRARSSQLESGLNDLKDIPHDPETEPSELERGMVDLRQQLRKAEEDLQTAHTRIEKTERIQQELEQDGAKYKKWYEATKVRLDLVSTTHNEKEEARQKLFAELNAANEQLDQLSTNTKTLETDLNDVRKEQLATEAKLKAAQQRDSSKSAEITSLKEQLRQKNEELQFKTQDYVELERQYTNMSNKANDFQGRYDQVQAQLSQHLSTMGSTRQEVDHRISEAQQDAQDTLQSTQDQNSTLQQEKQNLLTRLEQVRSNEARLNKAEATFSAAQKKLQQQLTDMQTAKESKEEDLRRMQADTAEQDRELTEKHRTEIDDWSRRLTQTNAALKEAEANLRLSEDQYQKKLASDRKRAEDNLIQVEQKYKTALQAATKQTKASQHHASQSSIVPDKPSTTLQSIHAGKSWKKASRQNNSVLNIAGSSTAQSSIRSSEPSSIFHTQVSQTRRERIELSPNLFDEPGGADDLFDENGLLVAGHETEYVPDTQEVGTLSMPQDVFDERLAQASKDEAKRQNQSSTDFSSIASDDLRQMQKDVQPQSRSGLCGHDHNFSKHGSSQTNTKEIPLRSDNVSVASSRSSQSHERPRSQANTASRMMPPPGNVSHHFQSRNQAQGGSAKILSRHGLLDNTGQKFSSSSTSTLDFIHPPSSVSKQTYSQHNPRNIARSGSRQSTPRTMERSRTEKRKSSTSQTERDTVIKKQRTSSQSYPVAPSSASRNQSPFTSRSSVVGSRSKTQAGPAYAQAVSSTKSRSKTQASSSSIQPHPSSQVPSSSAVYTSRRQQPSSSQTQAAASTRSTSSRLTRSKSRNGAAFDVDDRFDKELRGR